MVHDLDGTRELTSAAVIGRLALAFGVVATGVLAVARASGIESDSKPQPQPVASLLGEQRSFRAQALQAWDAQDGDWFAYDLALSGERLVVGIPYDDLVGGNSGSAATFVRETQGWSQTDALVPRQGARGDYFGMAVAIDGSRCVVGAPWSGERAAQAGCAYVFEWDGQYWNQRARLFAEDARAGDNLGVCVAIDGDRIVVGARWSGSDQARSGAAYVFEERRGEWKQSARLLSSDAQQEQGFGFSLAIEAQTIAVGAFATDDKRGAVYVFDEHAGRWSETVKLSAPRAAPGDCFGLALDLVGDEVLVGAPWRDDGGTDSGAAYLYRRGFRAWMLKETWTAPAAQDGEYFGCSVALSKHAVLIGARYGGREVPKSGAAYVAFREASHWAEFQALPRQFPVAEDAFGLVVAIDGNSAVVAARELDVGGAQRSSGSCHWYDLSETP